MSPLLGYSIVSSDVQSTIEYAWAILDSGRSGGYMACANPHSLMVAEADEEFAQALRDAEILLPDGIGIVLARRYLRRPSHGRIAGHDFFHGLTQSAQTRRPLRYFFLGSTEDTLLKIKARLIVRYPWIEVCGTYSPPFVAEFGQIDLNRMIDVVHTAKPDVLWIGMTAPKQEKLIHAHRAALNVPLTGAIGAVFDFIAGNVKRPEWAARVGIEWLIRFAQQPGRLWRRNFISTPRFIWRVATTEFRTR